MKKNSIVIVESTVYPGVTEEICVPLLEKGSKLKFNKTFFCGYSPERINPGDKIHSVDKITKVVSSNNKKSLKILPLKKSTFLAFLGMFGDFATIFSGFWVYFGIPRGSFFDFFGR